MVGLRNSLIYWGRSMEKFFMLMMLIALATAVGMSVMSGEVDFGYILYDENKYYYDYTIVPKIPIN